MARDYYLQTLVELAEGSEYFVGVTLTVRGLLISGTLVSERQWLEELTTYIGNTPEAPEGQSLALTLQTMAGVFDELRTELRSEPHANFIHLKDAQMFPSSSGNVLPRHLRTFWRGSLDSVDGFCIGALAQTSEAEDFDTDFDDLHDLE